MRPRSLLVPVIATVVVAAVALGFGKSRPATAGSSAVASSKTVSIKIHNFVYDPATLTVQVGTKITVTNTDQTAHTLTARSGAFDTGTIQPGKSMSFTVTKPGVYAYYCQFHAFMSGELKVIK